LLATDDDGGSSLSSKLSEKLRNMAIVVRPTGLVRPQCLP
jgi:hypothetical protein